MATVTDRRKAVTYGKAHRRIFGTANFMPESGPQPTWEAPTSRSASRHNTPDITCSLESQRVSSYNASEVRHVHRDPKSDQLKFDHAVFEFLSSEDEISINHPSDAFPLAAKRRKLTPTDDSEADLPVFDDDSLQMHIAAEVNGKTAPVRKLSVGGRRRALQAKANPKISQQWDSPRPVRESPGPKKPHSLGRKLKAKPIIAPTLSGARYPAAKMECQQNRTATAAPTNTRPRTPSAKQGPPRDQYKLPVTPSRSMPTANVACTTPRQRDMWDRLLAPEQYNQSPSQLNISKLEIALDEDEIILPSPEISSKEKMGDLTRPRRLIDTLNASTYPARRPGVSDLNYASENTSTDDDSQGVESSPLLNSGVRIHKLSPSRGSDHQTQRGVDEQSNGPLRVPSSYVLRGSKVTYAQQRSYLTDDVFSEKASLSLEPPPAKQFQARNLRQGSVPPLHHHIVDDDDMGEDEDVQGGAMRSVHELREAGGNVRLIGELESLLDELDECGNSTASARSVLINLGSKLHEPSKARLFVDNGLETRLLDCLPSNATLITKSLKAMLLLQLLVHSDSPVLLSRTNGAHVKNFLLGLLESTQDLKRQARGREANMSKIALQEYTDSCNAQLCLSIWQPVRPAYLSCQVLGLQCLRQLAVWSQRGGTVTELLSGQQIQHLVQNTIPNSSLSPGSDSTSDFCLSNGIFIIEVVVVGAPSAPQGLVPTGAIDRITRILPNLRLDEHDTSILQIPTLHLYFNLTQNVPGVCNAFAQSEAVPTMFGFITSYFISVGSDMAHDEQTTLNKAILSLLCLMNIAEVSDAMRKQCMLQAGQEPSTLDALVELYTKNNHRVTEVCCEDEITSNVPFGYLSVLICFLCLNAAARARVQARLANHSMQPLLDSVDEFLKYHKVIDKAINDEGLIEGQPGFVERVQALLDHLMG